MELNNATKSTKKELKIVYEWAAEQLQAAADSVVLAQIGLETSKEGTEDEKETSKEE